MPLSKIPPPPLFFRPSSLSNVPKSDPPMTYAFDVSQAFLGDRFNPDHPNISRTHTNTNLDMGPSHKESRVLNPPVRRYCSAHTGGVRGQRALLRRLSCSLRRLPTLREIAETGEHGSRSPRTQSSDRSAGHGSDSARHCD
jgi:hypothetical protein